MGKKQLQQFGLYLQNRNVNLKKNSRMVSALNVTGNLMGSRRGGSGAAPAKARSNITSVLLYKIDVKMKNTQSRVVWVVVSLQASAETFENLQSEGMAGRAHLVIEPVSKYPCIAYSHLSLY